MGLYDTAFSNMTPRQVVGAAAPFAVGFGLASQLLRVPGVFAYSKWKYAESELAWTRSGIFGKMWMLMFTLPLLLVIKLPFVIFINWVVGPFIYVMFGFMVLLAIAAAFAAAIPFFMGAYLIINAIVS